MLDRNGDGTINNISELFGNLEQTGFEELSELDSNSDGIVNADWVDGGSWSMGSDQIGRAHV